MKSARGEARQVEEPTPTDHTYVGEDRSDPLLRVVRCLDHPRQSKLASDVRRGLTLPQKTLPSKYLYDDRGSQLFDVICDLPEYYPTRVEEDLLRVVGDSVIDLAHPSHVVELGSGSSRKTRVLLAALSRVHPTACYVPVDVSEGMLCRSAVTLRRDYPLLRVHGIVGDYERHLQHMPAAERRLVIFLGSTIGNFTSEEAGAFLRCVSQHLAPGDFLLLGVDLVKPAEVLHAAYNDSAGVTAEFNQNLLRILNRELRANFDLRRFMHVAFFNAEAAQVEMHLRACEAHEVHFGDLDFTVTFAAGETIRTEISRKFTRATTEAMLCEAGFRLDQWFAAPNNYFALALATVGAAA